MFVRTEQTRKRTRAPSEEGLTRAFADSRGYSVVSPIGPLGTVEAVRFVGRPRRPLTLVVRTGGSGGDTIALVSVAGIEAVVPETRQILLRPNDRSRLFSSRPRG
jgi:hypothetical protein